MKSLLFFISFIFLPGSALADSGDTHEYTLENGLKVIVREDHRSPIVTSQVWYRVGSAYESYGHTGLAHALEHMMFKGTPKYPDDTFSQMIKQNGGTQNATTNYDATRYFQTIAREHLPLCFELEADRMQNIIIDPVEFKKEIKVVMEERRMRTDDNPQSLTWERFSAAAHVSNPYHHPIIGWMNDLENMRVEDLQRFYQTWYVPNNAVLVVVGDVVPDEVLSLAKKYFGEISPASIPVLKPQREIPPKGSKLITVKAPAKLPYIIMGYNTPSLKTIKDPKEAYALEVLANVLDGGNSARIEKDIVRNKKIATDAGAGYRFESRFDDLFLLVGTPSEKYTTEDLKTAFLDLINSLKTHLVSPEEFERIKINVIANKIYAKDSIEHQAYEIGSFETRNLSWKTADEYAQQINKVTPEQVRQVAKKYLIDDRLTVAVLDPQPIGETHAN